MEPYLVYGNNHIDPVASYFVVWGVCVLCLVVLGLAVQHIVQARRAEKAAEGAHNPYNPLVQGSRFAAGQIEYAHGETVAADVTVTQIGTEQSTKNGYTHQWNEVGRVVRARPFYLRHVSGARVRVEPPPHIVLVDRLDQRSWQMPFERRLRAALTPGEFATVEGQLSMGPDPEAASAAQGYRDGGMGWVMRPRPDGGMEASTESLSRRHDLRARGLTRAALWAAVVMAVGALPTVGFWARVVMGDDHPVQIVSLDAWTSRDSKGRRTRHWAVRVTDPNLATTSERYEVDEHDYNEMQRRGIGAPSYQYSQYGRYGRYGQYGQYHRSSTDVPDRVWMRLVPNSPSLSALGRGVSVHVGAWIFFGIAGLIGMGIVAAAHGHRRWYEGKARHNGNGRIGPPSGERFADEPAPPMAPWAQQGAPQWPAPGAPPWPASSR